MFSYILDKIPFIKELKIGLIIALFSIIAFLWYNNQSLQKDKIQLNVEKSALETEIIITKDLYNKSKEEWEVILSEIAVLQKGMKNIREDTLSTNKTLEGFKNREEVVIKKPSLVERRINNASERVLHEWECTPNC